MVSSVTSEGFTQSISSGITFVDFYATWCQPCKLMAPEYAMLSEEHSDFSFLKVDIMEEPELAKEYMVKSIPTVIAFKNGEAISRHMGSRDLEGFVFSIMSAQNV